MNQLLPSQLQRVCKRSVRLPTRQLHIRLGIAIDTRPILYSLALATRLH